MTDNVEVKQNDQPRSPTDTTKDNLVLPDTDKKPLVLNDAARE